METKKTVVEKYNRELEEITQLVELYKDGEIPEFQLINKVKSLAIRTYYDGMSKGIKDTVQIYRN